MAKVIQKKRPVKKPTKKAPPKARSNGHLSRVTTEVTEDRPILCCIHGVGGVGKTSWAGNLPSPVFICDQSEGGIDDLKRAGNLPAEIPVFPYAKSWDDILEMTQELIDGADDIEWETVVYDSLTGLEYLCFRHHCEEAFDGDWSRRGFFNYQQGPKNAAKTEWPRFLGLLEELRDKGYNVVLIGHSQIRNFNNPEGSDFERWVPYLDKETWAITYRSMECVLFANYLIDVEKDSSKGVKAKGKGGELRYLHAEWTAAYDAKNRWGLPALINMGSSGKEAASNFLSALKETGRQG